jgi:hypothetical protein
MEKRVGGLFGRWGWRLGGAVAYQLFNFPPYPYVLLPLTETLFDGLKAGAVVIGLILGSLYSRKDPAARRRWIAIAVLAILFVGCALWYFSVVRDAENHYWETLLLFGGINIMVGMLMVVASYASSSVNGQSAARSDLN